MTPPSHSSTPSGCEPFPAFQAEPFEPRAASSGNALRRRGKSSDANSHGNLATSLAHLSGVDSSSVNNKLDSAAREKRVSRRRKARSVMRRVKQYAVRHTWVLPLAIMLVILTAYGVCPTESNPLYHFIFLSYPQPLPAGASPDTAIQYGKGYWDIAFVAFYTVVLSFTREFIMHELLHPLARYYGLRSRSKQARFMEQMYTAVYFGLLGPAGIYVMSRTPVWFFNTRGMYENFPHKTHDAYFKFYYLFEAAYWAQQAIVLILGMEKPRKDFKELVAHHIVSLSLIALSYRFHFTYIGLAVYITHDISDFFLATSKSLNYVDGPFMGPYYFFFICVWVYLRHFLNLRILYSLFTEFKTVGPYELNWQTEQYKCSISFVITTALLSSLQTLNIIWLFFIIRVAYRYVVHNVAKDDRSDVEEEVDADEANNEQKVPLLSDKAANGTPAVLLNGAANGAAADSVATAL